MTENELKSIEKYRDLKEDPFYPFDQEKEDLFDNNEFITNKILSSRDKLNILLNDINKISPEAVLHIKRGVLHAIESLLKIILPSVNGYRLSKNQGLIIENAIYPKLSRVIGLALKTGFVVHSDFVYSKSDDSFDEAIVQEVLERHMNLLNDKEFESFLELENDTESLIDEVRGLAKK